MTTIITDGRILLADNRTTGTGPAYRGTNLKTGRESNKAYSDSKCKIVDVSEYELYVGQDLDSKVVAYAYAGRSGLETLIGAVMQAVCGEGKKVDLDKVLSIFATRFFGDAGYEIVFITEDKYSLYVDIDGGGYTVKKYNEGVFVAAGSGCKMVEYFHNNISDKASLEDYMILASAFDKMTSSSYSSYDNAKSENKLVMFNEVPQAKCRQVLKGMMTEKFDFSAVNFDIYTNVA